MSFQLAEALSWAVAGELMLQIPGPIKILYPDTMANYDNLWLEDQQGRTLAIMNRLGGSLPENGNIWRFARQDPRLAAAAILANDPIPLSLISGDVPSASLAFRVAHWLLEGLPIQVNSSQPPRRAAYCFGNNPDGLTDADKNLLPPAWHDVNPKYLHVLLSKEKPAVALNFATAESSHISGNGLRPEFLRDDGLPGCPLGHQLTITTKDGTSWTVFAPVHTFQRMMRNYMEEGWDVTAAPLFTLGEERFEIDSLPEDFNLEDHLN